MFYREVHAYKLYINFANLTVCLALWLNHIMNGIPSSTRSGKGEMKTQGKLKRDFIRKPVSVVVIKFMFDLE